MQPPVFIRLFYLTQLESLYKQAEKNAGQSHEISKVLKGALAMRLPN
jgi:hypothetical protein